MLDFSMSSSTLFYLIIRSWLFLFFNIVTLKRFHFVQYGIKRKFKYRSLESCKNLYVKKMKRALGSTVPLPTLIIVFND